MKELYAFQAQETLVRDHMHLAIHIISRVHTPKKADPCTSRITFAIMRHILGHNRLLNFRHNI
jgi:hypothetical protein